MALTLRPDRLDCDLILGKAGDCHSLIEGYDHQDDTRIVLNFDVTG